MGDTNHNRTFNTYILSINKSGDLINKILNDDNILICNLYNDNKISDNIFSFKGHFKNDKMIYGTIYPNIKTTSSTYNIKILLDDTDSNIINFEFVDAPFKSHKLSLKDYKIYSLNTKPYHEESIPDDNIKIEFNNLKIWLKILRIN